MAKSVNLPVDLEVSDAVRVTLYQHDYEFVIPEGEEDNDAYENVRRGRCMLCGNTLAEDTLVLVTPMGLTGIWCDHECMTDHNVIGWLQEILQGITEKYIGVEGDEDESS